MLFVFLNTLSGATFWTFVIDGRRVCSPCFILRSRGPVPDFCDEQAAHMLFMFLIYIPAPVPIL